MRSLAIAELLKKEYPVEAPVIPAETLAAPPAASKAEIAAWVILAAGFVLIFMRGLVPGLMAGILFYLLLDRTTRLLTRRVSRRALRPLSILVATVVGGAAVTGAFMLIMAIIRAQLRNIPALMARMASILESTRLWLGQYGGQQILPEAVRDAEDLKLLVVGWLKSNATVITYGEAFGFAIVHMVMGLLLAMMVYLRHANPQPLSLRGPLARHLTEKVDRLTTAFSQVIVAQVMISAINTILTAIYLLVVLPLWGRPLPFSLTIVFITFVCGLIPVIGNLISNTVITIVSLGVSPGTAIASLAFLIIIHKLEYVVNSRIIGSKTGSQIWEILLAILVGDAAFGLQGIILAPVIYTFAKRELKSKGLV